MVDTARTVAAIKALFADNATGAISEQDLRDFVESVANPVAGGGFGSVFDPDQHFFKAQRYSGVGQLAKVYSWATNFASPVATCETSTYYALDWTTTDDEYRFYHAPFVTANAAPVPSPDYWGDDLPVGTVLDVAAGVYELYQRWEFTEAVPPDSNCYLDFVDGWPGNGGADDPFDSQFPMHDDAETEGSVCRYRALFASPNVSRLFPVAFVGAGAAATLKVYQAVLHIVKLR